ncbi:LCP family protein [Pilimelia columellifera]|uniref:LCP family protein n=1 Tax=Pilimelia columellifera subsp. columellifera TaxID=706583 RepID=A0ABN3NEP2_9ACTN
MTEQPADAAPAADAVAADAANRPTATIRRRRVWILTTVGVLLLALLGGGAIAVNAAQSRYTPQSANLFGDASPSPSNAPSARPATVTVTGQQLRGPLNFLIVGIDPRVSVPNWRPHADAVLLMHVPAAHDQAYLYSLPRDLIVNIPAFKKANFPGERTKLTHAMSYGSVVPGKAKPDRAQGFELLAATVTKHTGISFNAGAVIDFPGFTALVDALGGVDMKVDRKVVSIHRKPNGEHRRPGASSTGYLGPQMVYQPGVRRFTGWQALDYSRQRYLTGGDYTRQKHQQQLIRAILTKVAQTNAHTDPAKLDKVLTALRDSLTFDGRGQAVTDFAFTLRNVSPAKITLVSLPGAGVGVGSAYRGESLKPVGAQFLAAVRGGTVAPFLVKNPKLAHSR